MELVVYDPATGQPWPAQAGDLALTPNGLRLGEVTVVRPDPSPPMQPALATFGPLALIEATSPATTVAPGGQVPVELLWQAAEAPGEPFVVVVQLQDAAGQRRRRAGGAAAGRPLSDAGLGCRRARARPAHPHAAGRPGAGRVPADRGPVSRGGPGRLETKTGLFGKSDHWVVTTVEVK